MSRQRQDPLARAVAAFRDLTAEQQSTFLLAVALAGTIQEHPPLRPNARAKPNRQEQPKKEPTASAQ